VCCGQEVGWELLIEREPSLQPEEESALVANVYCPEHRRNIPQHISDATRSEQSSLIAEYINKKRNQYMLTTKGERRAYSWQLESSQENVSPVDEESHLKTRCYDCHIDVSPVWWPKSIDKNAIRCQFVCQKCHDVDKHSQKGLEVGEVAQ